MTFKSVFASQLPVPNESVMQNGCVATSPLHPSATDNSHKRWSSMGTIKTGDGGDDGGCGGKDGSKRNTPVTQLQKRGLHDDTNAQLAVITDMSVFGQHIL
jgi:hypothetical protein